MMENVLLAFCWWTRKDHDNGDNGNKKPTMNITKAFCHLKTMHSSCMMRGKTWKMP